MISRRQSDDYIPVLDGIRGLSILWVILHHLPVADERLFGVLKFMKDRGELGVEMFFAVSGFLVTRSLEECKYTVGSGKSVFIPAKAFLLRRIARIWPPYYATLLLIGFSLIYSAHTGISELAGSASSIIWSIPTFLANYTMPSFSGAGHLGGVHVRSFSVIWSLCFEEQFYFGLILLFLLSPKHYWRWMVSFGVLSIGWRIASTWIWPGIKYQDIHMMTHYRWDAIAWACAAWINRDRVAIWISMSWVRRVFIWIGCAASITFFRFWDPITPLQAAVAFAFTAPLFTLLLVWLFSVQSPVRSVLEWLPFVLLGEISYELYLTHLFIIAWVTKGLAYDDLWGPIELIGLCVAVAWGFHTFFGKPSRQWVLALGKAHFLGVT